MENLMDYQRYAFVWCDDIQNGNNDYDNPNKLMFVIF